MFEELFENFILENPYKRKLQVYNHADLIDFASSDYLGLAEHPLLIARSFEYAQRFGVGSKASRLVSGNLQVCAEIESSLAEKFNKPAAIIFPSGFQANFFVIEALLTNPRFQKPVTICDRLCHISILQAAQQFSQLTRFKHNDYDHLEFILKKYPSRPKFIFAESIYSMEGDAANLEKLIELAKKYRAFLYIDEAHSLGVQGADGFGIAKHYANDIDIIMGTFSKGLGSQGGFVAASSLMKNYLINKCKGLIYSTAVSPLLLGAIAAALELVPQYNLQRKELLIASSQLRHFLDEHKINYGNSTTHIIPWIIGDADLTLKAAESFINLGILATAIRPPSVSKNQSRIRFCLTTKHTQENLDLLRRVILDVKQKL